MGTADKAILIQIGRCNIKAAVKIKPDFIAGKAALRQVVLLTVKVKAEVLTRKFFKTTQIHPKFDPLIFPYKGTFQTTGVDMSAVYFPKLVLP